MTSVALPPKDSQRTGLPQQDPEAGPDKAPLPEMELMDHLRELRKRLIWSSIFVIVGAVVSYYQAEAIFNVIAVPYRGAFGAQPLVGSGMAEAFTFKIKLAIFSGILLTSPLLFHQFWLFISPGLYAEERRLVIPFVLISTGLFLCGVWFCYTYVLPIAFAFFRDEYQSIGVAPMVRVSEHLSTLLHALIGFGAVFELPVVAYFLARVGLLTSNLMKRTVRYAIVIIFILSAVLTPPDVVSQFLMAGPLLLLYGLSYIIVRFTEGKKGLEETTATP